MPMPMGESGGLDALLQELMQQGPPGGDGEMLPPGADAGGSLEDLSEEELQMLLEMLQQGGGAGAPVI